MELRTDDDPTSLRFIHTCCRKRQLCILKQATLLPETPFSATSVDRPLQSLLPLPVYERAPCRPGARRY